MWQEGTIDIPVKKEAEKEYIAVHYTLKVYDEPSKFGINHGKISKLQLKQNGKIVANYDRGWDIHPTTKETELALCILLNRHIKEISIMTTMKYAASGEQRRNS